MLQTFTKDDRLREQYRLHEELLRVQRGEEARKEKLKQQYNTALIELAKERKANEEERKAKEKALRTSEEERKAKEEALRTSEEERKAKEKALKNSEEIQKVSIISLRKAGYSNDDIAKMLNMALTIVESLLKKIDIEEL